MQTLGLVVLIVVMLDAISFLMRLVIVVRTRVPITVSARIVSGVCGCCDEHR